MQQTTPSVARQSEINAYLQTSMPIALQAEGFDHYQTFMNSRHARWSGTIMPPGPAVEMYAIEAYLHGVKMIYRANVKWRPWIQTLARRVEPWQITHRSRKIACSHPHLQMGELDYRLAQTNEMRDAILKDAATERQSHELYDMIVSVTKKYLTFNRDWIQQYIKDHETSSLGFGHKWREAYQIGTDQWKDLYQIQKTNWDVMERGAGMGSNILYLFGIRARTGRLEGINSIIEEEKERDRIITFFPPLSTVTTFLPQKAAWYTEILNNTIDICNAQPEYHFPYAVGGQIYRIMADLHRDGPPFTALDGRSWDSSVGLLMGDNFKPMMINFKGTYFLPSGISLTSLIGTVAEIVATRNTKGIIIGLSDDVNFFGDPANAPERVYIAKDDGDTRHKYGLGVTYGVDPDVPRITGFKATMDRSTKARPFHVGFDLSSMIMGYKRDIRSQVAWAGLFEGRFGERTLLEALEGIPPGKYLSPGETMERLIEEDDKEVDVFAWAEEQGIKNIFM